MKYLIKNKMIKILHKTDLIHFVGIGGIGMSGIAELMANLGYIVQGSDTKINENIKRLQNKKIKIFIGHKKKNIKHINVLVFSSAIKKNNIELMYAVEKRLPVVSRAEMLGELMRFKRSIAVAGSHGKTTTTSILSSILQKAKIDPTIVNGGIINSLSSNSKMGKGKWMVVEADESDGSFLHLPNEINIITNIDYEHMDYYKKFSNLYDSFKKFSSNIPFYGSSIICLESKNTKKLASQIIKREIITYGINKLKADLNIVKIKYMNNKSIFSLVISSRLIKSKQKYYSFYLNTLGEHNILNSTAAIAASLKIGVKISIIKKALLEYKGVQRRFTLLKKIRRANVYDDYAHHPIEIKASMSIARHLCKKKVILIFQPHRYTRTKYLFNDFINILKKADVLIISKIYSAGEKEIKGLDKKLFNNLKKISKNKVIKFENENELFSIVDEYTYQKNLIIFMGAGSITHWAKDFIINYR